MWNAKLKIAITRSVAGVYRKATLLNGLWKLFQRSRKIRNWRNQKIRFFCVFAMLCTARVAKIRHLSPAFFLTSTWEHITKVAYLQLGGRCRAQHSGTTQRPHFCYFISINTLAKFCSAHPFTLHYIRARVLFFKTAPHSRDLVGG